MAGPVLFNSPHSGSTYPVAFSGVRGSISQTCAARRTRYVDKLVAGVVKRGYPMMRAHFPRCYVDVNREPYELDPRMFEAGCRPSPIPARCGSPAGSAPWRASSAMRRKSMTGAFRSTKRCAGSKGSISPITAPCAAFSPKCTAFSARRYWSTAIRCRRRPGKKTSVRGRNSSSATAMAPVASGSSPSASRHVRGLGYTVSRNKPYAGGFITEHYGNPSAGTPCRAARDQSWRSIWTSGVMTALLIRRHWRRDLETMALVSAKFPSQNCAHIAQASGVMARQEKGPLANGKRPKSREETPKEGNGNSATALQQYRLRCKKIKRKPDVLSMH